MPKNTYFIKENYKKTEEIRYLEQNLAESYDFELDSYSDISSSKIYGPMYRASAETSVNERFTPFKTPCLEAGCNDTTIINWTHANCGSNFQISNRGCLKCNGCSLVENIKNFRFSCSSHNRNYRSVNNQMDINALKRALFSALSEGAMDESIILELIQYLNNNN